MDKEFGIDAPKDIQATQQSLSGLVDKLAQKYDVKLDATSATDAINKANEALNNLRSNASQPIIIRTQVSPGGSPSGPGAGGVQLGFTGSVSVDPKTGVTIPAGQDLRPIQTAFLDIQPRVVESPAVPFSKWLNEIAPAKIKKLVDEVADMGLTFKPKASGSPELPLSDYFQNYAMGVVQNFAKEASATSITFDTNITNMMGSVLGQMIDAREAIAKWSADIPFRADFVGDFTVGPRARLAALEDTLKYLERMGTRSASPSAGPGGGGGIVFNAPIIDMSNSTITPDAIDLAKRNLLPAIEQALGGATGKTINLRVLN